MRIYFTGASSFTGYWFAKTLAEAGHEVVAAFTKGSVDDYADIYRTRVELLLPLIAPIWTAPMGSDAMLHKLSSDSFDLLCLHGAVVGNHKAPDFPVMEAVRQNTLNLDAVLATAKASGIKAVVHTGTYFEADEGIGTEPREAFSPYALSKTLTWHCVRFACYKAGIPLGKFVVANPFGPLEKGGFTQYLIQSWKTGKTPVVQTPDYVRDNVPVDLMALHYLDFCTALANPELHLQSDLNMNCQSELESSPSCYAGEQGDFAKRFAAEFAQRSGISCLVEFAEQRDFSEPMERKNSDTVPGKHAVSWCEDAFWDMYFSQYCR
jgi:hypothetical protein